MKTTFFLIICLIIGLYFIINLILQLTKNTSRNKKIEEAKQNMFEANKAKNLAKENLIKEIAKQFDNNVAEKVSKGIIWNGMPDFLLIAAMGKANEIRESFLRGTTTEKWYFGGYRNRLGNVKYNLEVIVENNKVIGWKDLY